MNPNKNEIATLLCMAVLVLSTCTGDYNPFLDPSNARASAKKSSFANKASVQIFSTETLVVAVSDRDLVDSFKVSSPKNRNFRDTTIYNGAIVPMASYYSFLISEKDTGLDTISIKTYKKNGDITSPEQYIIQSKSPLRQAPISGNFGDSIAVATPPVLDNDVKYHWSFGKLNKTFDLSDSGGKIIILNSDTYDSASVGTGQLYVSDKFGKNASPSYPFQYNLKDLNCPVILSFNDNYFNTETITTSDSTFLFKVQIFDLGQSAPVCSATVNSAAFDRVVNDKYIKIIPKMDTVKNGITLHVRAMDNLRNKNVATKDFVVLYSKSAAHASSALINVILPALSSSNMATVATSPKGIFGSIEDYSAADSLNLTMTVSVNNVKQPTVFVAKGKVLAYWNFNVDLPSGMDTVKVCAYTNPFGDPVACTNFYLTYDSTLSKLDTIKPKILDIMATTLAGKTITNGISDLDTAVIRVIAVDGETYVDSLKINSQAIKSLQNPIQYIWYDTVKILHRTKGDTVFVKAFDKAHNASRDTGIYVIYNRLPKITKVPNVAVALKTGILNTDVIAATDPDDDVVTFTKKSGPAGVTVSAIGVISWTPQKSDTGVPQEIVITVSDNIQSFNYPFTYSVENAANNVQSVRFATWVNTFPQYLQANKDSLMTTFHLKAGTGKPPFTFTVKNISAIMKDSVLTWKPLMADTGVHNPVVAVQDQNGTSDTLYLPQILVVPPNRAFTLSARYSIPMLPDSSLDMRNRLGPDTIQFTIFDPDTSLVDKHTVTIMQSQTKTVYSLDSSRTFLVIVDPSKIDKSLSYQQIDTIKVSVVDLAGHSASKPIVVRYADARAMNKKISFNTKTTGANTTTNVLNFPLLIRLDTSNFDFSVVNKEGKNVYFRKANGDLLPFEIDMWDSANGLAAVWVKIDTVFANSTSQYIFMAWSDTGISIAPSAADVFSSADGFVGAWHLSDGGTGNRINSANSVDYSFIPKGYTGNESVAGLIGKADSLNTANAHDTVNGISISGSFTMSLWVSPTSLTNGAKIMYNSGSNGALHSSLELATSSGATKAAFKVQYRSGGGGGFGGTNTATATSISSLQLNQWVNLTTVFNGNSISMYVNGHNENTTTIMGIVNPNSQQPSYLCWDPNSSALRFKGIIDEPRILTGNPPSDDWIWLSYQNQKPVIVGNTFITIK